VTVLLLIACANVSGLLLTRMALRHREHGVRLALGATRAQVGRIWLAEVLLIAAAGGVLGLAAASWALRAILTLAPGDLLHAESISIDSTVAAFTIVLVTGAALLSGLLPLGQLGRTNMVDALAAGARNSAGRSSIHWRSVLVVGQVALAVVLLIGAGLLVRSFVHLRQIDLGFASDHVVTMVVQPRSAAGPPNEWFRELLERVEGLPDVAAAGAVYLRPLALGPIGQGVLVILEGQPETPQAAQGNPTLNHQIATPGYFEAMRIRIIRGRGFTDADSANSPRVALVSESTARTLWPGQDAVGKRIRMSSFTPGSGPSWREVVGVVSDVRYRGLTDVHLDVYDPARQVGRPATNLVVRTTGDTAALVAGVREHARQLDPTVIVDDVVTLESIVARASAAWRMSMWLFVAFAAMAFALSALGLFGLVALDVTHRAQEFAVRLALGSSRAALVRRVIGQAWWRAGAGLAAGLGAATLGAAAMQSLLYEVRPIDPATYAAVAGLVAIVVTLAAFVPARRAARETPQALFRSGD
jgi:predicted permease